MGVWIDTDMGFDDIAAILVVDQSGLEIDGISLVFGNTPLPQVRANAAGAAQAFGWKFPIHAGRGQPVLAKLETAQAILGETGIPTIGKSCRKQPHSQTATPSQPSAAGWSRRGRDASWRSAR